MLPNSTKILCFKALQNDPEESSKAYLKGIIDSLFTEEYQKKALEKKKKSSEKKEVH